MVGAHSNVGGGYKNNDLHQIPRYWMQQKAMGAGLIFHKELKPVKNALGETIVDSYDEFLAGLHKQFTPRVFRSLKPHKPEQGGEVINEQIHETVWQYYIKNNSYRPHNIPGEEIAANVSTNETTDNIA